MSDFVKNCQMRHIQAATIDVVTLQSEERLNGTQLWNQLYTYNSDVRKCQCPKMSDLRHIQAIKIDVVTLVSEERLNKTQL